MVAARGWGGNGGALPIAVDGVPGTTATISGTLPVNGARTISTNGTAQALSQGAGVKAIHLPPELFPGLDYVTHVLDPDTTTLDSVGTPPADEDIFCTPANPTNA